jgi:O-antigen ligase
MSLKTVHKQHSISSNTLFYVFAFIIVSSCWLSAALESYFPLAIPALVILVYLTVVDFRSIFYLLLVCIPISTEFQFPNGLGTDLPTEPLIIGLMLVYLLFVLKKGLTDASILRGGASFLRHPITAFLLLHLGWILVCTINSQAVVFSIKYFLAKIWYIVTFYFLAGHILQKEKDIKRFFWCIFIPLSIAIVITLIRYSGYGFAFSDVNKVMYPMFRNHVNYACILTLFAPFLLLGRYWQRRFSFNRWLINGSIVLFLIAIQFSYTRAAYIALLGAIGYYFILKFRLTKAVLAIGFVVMIVGLVYSINGNRYLDFAPKFEKTITHYRFDNLLEATAKGEDISTMERVYRWIAGIRMVADKPLTGFGPANFTNFYKSYTVTDFKTYVSDNEENSTVHCYYLLLAIEQGILGALLFMGLVAFVLLRGEKVYHTSSGSQKQIVLTVLLSFVIILILLTINDLIETDKIGAFFFLNLAIIANLDIATRLKTRV